MSQSSSGQANETLVTVDLTRVGTPDFICHADRELRWMVWETVDSWRDPDPAASPSGTEAERHRVRAYGPFPWRPSENGDLTLIVRRYADRDGWWISPE